MVIVLASTALTFVLIQNENDLFITHNAVSMTISGLFMIE